MVYFVSSVARVLGIWWVCTSDCCANVEVIVGLDDMLGLVVGLFAFSLTVCGVVN